MRVALVPLGPGHGSGEVSWNVCWAMTTTSCAKALARQIDSGLLGAPPWCQATFPECVGRRVAFLPRPMQRMHLLESATRARAEHDGHFLLGLKGIISHPSTTSTLYATYTTHPQAALLKDAGAADGGPGLHHRLLRLHHSLPPLGSLLSPTPMPHQPKHHHAFDVALLGLATSCPWRRYAPRLVVAAGPTGFEQDQDLGHDARGRNEARHVRPAEKGQGGA